MHLKYDIVRCHVVFLCHSTSLFIFFFFFFNDPATTEIYTLSLHDALPISGWRWRSVAMLRSRSRRRRRGRSRWRERSEEHTSELQSRFDLVCRLLLEKKKKIKNFKSYKDYDSSYTYCSQMNKHLVSTDIVV